MAVRTKNVATPMALADFDKVLKLGYVTSDEQTYLRAILKNQKLPGLTIDMNTGWVDGVVGVAGSLQLPTSRGGQKLDLRVFDTNHPPPGGFFKLPAHVITARLAKDERQSKLKAEVDEKFRTGPLQLVVKAKPPTARRRGSGTATAESFDEKSEHSRQSTYDSCVMDNEGNVLLEPGTMVAVLTATGAPESSSFPYSIGQFIGVAGDIGTEGLVEGSDAAPGEEKETNLREEEDEPMIWVHWFGNERNEKNCDYSTESVWHPGWVDREDGKMMFLERLRRNASNVSRDVVRYCARVPITSVALHDFPLSKQHKLPKLAAEQLIEYVAP